MALETCQVALKWLFFLKNKSKKLPKDWGICPQIPIYDMLALHHFAQLFTELRHFSSEKLLTLGFSHPPLFCKILVACLFTGVSGSRDVDIQNCFVHFLKDQLLLFSWNALQAV